MKIRIGFISNSSSSSFIVYKKRISPKDTVKLLTRKQSNLLDKFGFKGDDFSVSYEVICNQDEVIIFLLKNRIPFTAECHYDHETLLYQGKELIYEFPNFGKQIGMYGLDHLVWREKNTVNFEDPVEISNIYSLILREHPLRISTRKEYLKLKG
jgi:hypothetical protein